VAPPVVQQAVPEREEELELTEPDQEEGGGATRAVGQDGQREDEEKGQRRR
jgi:hypothetical protein